MIRATSKIDGAIARNYQVVKISRSVTRKESFGFVAIKGDNLNAAANVDNLAIDTMHVTALPSALDY